MRSPFSNLFPILLVFFVSMCAGPSPIPVQADSPWSRFHGSNGYGFVAEGEIPDSWTDKDYQWRYEFESTDVGSPIIASGSIYLLASRPQSSEISLLSIDLQTGQRKWSKSFAHPPHHLHKRNTFASSTPAADDQNVFIAFADPGHTYLKCFDHDGNEIWSRDFGRWQSQHGFGTSPRIVGSTVVLMNSQQADRLGKGRVPGRSRMVAVDRASGTTVWERDLRTTRTCYGVPATFQDAAGKIQLIGANTGDGIFGIDAKSGEMLWNLQVFDKRCCSTPLVVGDLAIGTCGSGGGGNQLVAVRIPKSADQQPTEIYRIDRAAPYVPTPVIKGDLMFTIADKGIASCTRLASGDVIWSERIGGNFGASPIVVGDKLLVISLRGEATVLSATEQFKKLGEVDLAAPVGATPAYAEGRLLIRAGSQLLCL